MANFLHYIDDRGYDGLVFGRVIPGFIIQVVGVQVEDGEYVDTGPPRDCIPSESGNGLSNVRGTVSLALISGDRLRRSDR